MDIITANGDRVHASRMENTDIFDAARCSLGCIGVIIRVKLQLERTFLLHAIQRPSSLPAILEYLMHTIYENDHVRFWWFPGTDDVVDWRANRRPWSTQRSPAQTSWYRDTLHGRHIFEFQLFIARYKQSLLPGIAKRKFQRFFAEPVEVVDTSHKLFNFDCLFSQYVNEWAIPLDQTLSALRALKKMFSNATYPVHFPVEIRFASADDIWMSPSYGRPTCWINVIMYRYFCLSTLLCTLLTFDTDPMRNPCLTNSFGEILNKS